MSCSNMEPSERKRESSGVAVITTSECPPGSLYTLSLERKRNGGEVRQKNRASICVRGVVSATNLQ